MNVVREPVVDGRFYPSNPAFLATLIESLIATIDIAENEPLARGYIVPHAGFRFSGPVAAQVYARLRKHANNVHKILLIGPSHYVPLHGIAGSPADIWHTPLGAVTTFSPAGVATHAAPHEREHSLEVQLPFLQHCLDSFTVAPLVVGNSAADDIANVLDQQLDESTILLCSTDLSHYHDQETAQRLDRATASAIIERNPAGIKTSDACGAFALRGTMAWATRHNVRIRQLALATSADTLGNRDRVVGYPAFAIG